MLSLLLHEARTETVFLGGSLFCVLLAFNILLK